MPSAHRHARTACIVLALAWSCATLDLLTGSDILGGFETEEEEEDNDYSTGLDSHMDAPRVGAPQPPAGSYSRLGDPSSAACALGGWGDAGWDRVMLGDGARLGRPALDDPEAGGEFDLDAEERSGSLSDRDPGPSPDHSGFSRRGVAEPGTRPARPRPQDALMDQARGLAASGHPSAGLDAQRSDWKLRDRAEAGLRTWALPPGSDRRGPWGLNPLIPPSDTRTHDLPPGSADNRERSRTGLQLPQSLWGGQGKVSGPPPGLAPPLGRGAWLSTGPTLHCNTESMSLTARGRRAEDLQIETDESLIPLSQLPSHCGHSWLVGWRQLRFTALYRDCYVQHRAGQYVLAVHWQGRRFVMSCPSVPPRVACSPSHMSVQLGGGTLEGLRVRVAGRWVSVGTVLAQCGYSWQGGGDSLVLNARYSSCGVQTEAGRRTLSLLWGVRELVLSCPAAPPSPPPPTAPRLTSAAHPSDISLSCRPHSLEVSLPSAQPGTLEVKGRSGWWEPVGGAPALCSYSAKTGLRGVLLFSSPLPGCHTQFLPPALLSLSLRFNDHLFRTRTLDLQCPMALPNTAPLKPHYVTPDPPLLPPPPVSVPPFPPPQRPSHSASSELENPPLLPPLPLYLPFTPPPLPQLLHYPTYLTPHTPWPLFAPSPSPPQLPQPSVSCQGGQFKVDLPRGPPRGIWVQASSGRKLPVWQAPVHCGYSVQQGAEGTTLTVPFTGCHVSRQGGLFTLQLVFLTVGGGRRGGAVSCPVPPSLQQQGCSVSSVERVQCGQEDMSVSQCRDRGCCVDTDTGGCYHHMDECSRDGHMVFVVHSSLSSPPLDPRKLRVVGGSECPPPVCTPNLAIFKIPLSGCGMRSFTVGQTTVYLAEVTNAMKTRRLNYGHITRDTPFRQAPPAR
ncbi:uncharacterized protein LOC136751902 [Amia ocellicauda]|uniref:uncharacterized protein LOC136751902 n=1 Tax=Amia ocellicauda TaxID=2972642 RepID=UPI003463EE0D